MTAPALLDRLRREGFQFDGSDGRLRVRPPVGRALAAEEIEPLRRHKDVLLAILQGVAMEAGPDWRPRLGESWPAAWRSGDCVRCGGRRWVWAESEGRWLCAACGASDPDRPMPTRPVAAPEPAGHAPPDDLAGWPPECLASERRYGTRSARLPEGPESAVSQDDLPGWSPECRAALRLYHQPPVLVAPHACLYPLIGRNVRTPHGVGKLLSVRSDGCWVLLDGRPGAAVMVDWQEVRHHWG